MAPNAYVYLLLAFSHEKSVRFNKQQLPGTVTMQKVYALTRIALH